MNVRLNFLGHVFVFVDNCVMLHHAYEKTIMDVYRFLPKNWKLLGVHLPSHYGVTPSLTCSVYSTNTQDLDLMSYDFIWKPMSSQRHQRPNNIINRCWMNLIFLYTLHHYTIFSVLWQHTLSFCHNDTYLEIFWPNWLTLVTINDLMVCFHNSQLYYSVIKVHLSNYSVMFLGKLGCPHMNINADIMIK